MNEVTLQCPYCFEWVDIELAPETRGVTYVDCPVCCRPWQLNVLAGDDGFPQVVVDRS